MHIWNSVSVNGITSYNTNSKYLENQGTLRYWIWYKKRDDNGT